MTADAGSSGTSVAAVHPVNAASDDEPPTQHVATHTDLVVSATSRDLWTAGAGVVGLLAIAFIVWRWKRSSCIRRAKVSRPLER